MKKWDCCKGEHGRISAQRRHKPRETGLEHRHHPHQAEERIRLPDRNHRLVWQTDIELTAFNSIEHRFLRRMYTGSNRKSGMPIHFGAVHRDIKPGWIPRQAECERQRTRLRQYFRGMVLKNDQIRGRVSERATGPSRRAGWDLTHLYADITMPVGIPPLTGTRPRIYILGMSGLKEPPRKNQQRNEFFSAEKREPL